MIKGSAAAALVGNYVQALSIRRKAHQMGALFGGRLPCSPIFLPGGCTDPVDAASITSFRTLLTEITSFINSVMLPDVNAVAATFPQYGSIGKGCGNMLAYGVFDLNAAGTTKLLARGRYTDGAFADVNTADITEYVKHSWYTAASGKRNPSVGLTTPSVGKAGAYSWLKAPRYQDKPHEVGALARMWVNGDYRNGISVVDRLAARTLEAKKIALAMNGWLSELVPGQPVYKKSSVPASGFGIGLTEAPRGALGHWVQISRSKIYRYQMVTPTGWNASPRDDFEVAGPIEQALIGTPVADESQPIEVLRVVHSFDPCLSCAVHVVRPGRRARMVFAPLGEGAL
jgi:hydrogenase large subunit